MSCDLSLSGIRLLTMEPVAPGSRLHLKLEFDDYTLPVVECDAEAVWCAQHGDTEWLAGCRFVNMTEEHFSALRDYLDFIAGYKRTRWRI